jgi:predicted ATPase
MAELTELGVLFYGPLVRTLIADVYLRAGGLSEAAAVVDEGLGIAARTGEAWTVAELHRQKGRLLSHVDNTGAEDCLNRAIATAQNQSAKLFELRASVCLARLWRELGRDAQAHALLARVFAWFSEGSDTPDLKEASEVVPGFRTGV